MFLLEGEMELTFENMKKTLVKAGQFIFLPKNVKHHCIFKKLTVALEGVYERGL
jgi:quercetin dioxygenase-like cupin family protein